MYLGRVERKRNREAVDVFHVQHGGVNDGDARKEVRVGTGEHGDFASPCSVTIP
jgi:hypothetical protein